MSRNLLCSLLLAREPRLDADTFAAIRARAAARGYAVDRLWLASTMGTDAPTQLVRSQ